MELTQLTDSELEQCLAADAAWVERARLDRPCAVRRRCWCGAENVVPLDGDGPERTVGWVCPLCDPDFEAAFAAWRHRRGRRGGTR